ncbi:nuclease-related domain-containing protein [Desulfofustis glycolicus]|uniref:Nuclease-related domain-containing protein n=1 Tax=Desulfofustis glycolicus DSM 9705 TaxID=1121409 RepID=A0A1M5YE13_9BACT|nr:nuclease-related domain-containing protein [Desulfofustis glycolicus]SHI10098.1 Nuclease-related domain-containing protein [Desulfofustis glycolicus DSM 9705]
MLTESTFIILVPSLVVVGMMLLPAYLIVVFFRYYTKKKKSPLNMNLLRSPGHSLREQIIEISQDIIGWLLMIPLVASASYAVFVTNRLQADGQETGLSVYVVILMVLGLAVYGAAKAYRMVLKRNTLRLGYECELAVGQELSSLIKEDYNIYHDFPADGFNIDHVAVGPSGVFAIETKGRAKQAVAEKENWKLNYDGVRLQFPTWTETEPVLQARRQAQWLEKWIRSSTGVPQAVVPVLAIPGWFIKRTGVSDVRVYNGKNPSATVNGQRVLSDQRIQAISHQIENKCRDVKSESYKKD